MEFDDICKIISNVAPMAINEFSLLEMKLSDREHIFENMLCDLNSAIKKYCNRSFTEKRFYTLIFIFITAGTKDKKCFSILNSLNNKIYMYGTKVDLPDENGQTYPMKFD